MPASNGGHPCDRACWSGAVLALAILAGSRYAQSPRHLVQQASGRSLSARTPDPAYEDGSDSPWPVFDDPDLDEDYGAEDDYEPRDEEFDDDEGDAWLQRPPGGLADGRIVLVVGLARHLPKWAENFTFLRRRNF